MRSLTSSESAGIAVFGSSLKSLDARRKNRTCEAYRRHLPHAEWKLLPRCGHMPMFECEKEFVETVATFCRG